MRRKLIQQEAFDQIANSSVTMAERELTGVEHALAQALGKDHLRLHSFTENTVVYETIDDTYVHATYGMQNENVTLTNIEELIIDHDSKKSKQKAIIGEMIDAVVVNDDSKASDLFKKYMESYQFSDAKKSFVRSKSSTKSESTNNHKRSKFNEEFKRNLRAKNKHLSNAYAVAENVLGFVDYLRFGPTLAESTIRKDESGNLTDIRMPNSHARNINRIQRSNWKSLNEKVYTLRKNALHLAEEQMFCKAMSDLRRQNGISDAQGLSEVLENVVNAFPSVLYVTQNELAKVIAEALSTCGETRFDDETCQFMAEGVLRTGHKAYQERVNQILHLASANHAGDGDAYDHFQSVVEGFYPMVDEKFMLERKVFNDLYESLEGLYQTADRRGDEALKRTTAGYLNELAQVLNERANADIELAEEVAHWLREFIETNLAGSDWVVSNKAHVTVSGDHPEMARKAAKSYTPTKDFSPDWGDELPMVGSDSMDYKSGKHSKQARSNSWGNEAGGDAFPNLKNPYVPKPFGDYTMKGETGVDKDTFGQHHATWNSSDTWPKLQNPYVPKGETAKTYKMNRGKEEDLIVDKG